MWNIKPWNILTAAVLAVAVLSCSGGNQTRELDRIESLVDSYPDSALVLLDAVDTTVMGASDRAQYTSMCMRAEINEFGTLIMTSQDEVRRAAEYFEWAGDKAEIAKMWTALAKEQSVKGNESLSASYYSYAAEMFRDVASDSSGRLQGARMRFFVALLFLFVLLVIFLNYRRLQNAQKERRMMEEKAETERLMNLAEDLQQKLLEADSRKGGLTENFEVLERLCEQYYVYEGTDNLQPKILKEVHSIVDGLRDDPAWLEERLNASSDNIMVKFREQFHGLKEDDIRLFCFVAAGFSSTTISTLLGRDKQYIYNRIYRLKNRISTSKAPDKEVFIKSFSK